MNKTEFALFNLRPGDEALVPAIPFPQNPGRFWIYRRFVEPDLAVVKFYSGVDVPLRRDGEAWDLSAIDEGLRARVMEHIEDGDRQIAMVRGGNAGGE